MNTYKNYRDHLTNIVSELKEISDPEERLVARHEMVDGSEYVIYHHKNLEVMEYSPNRDEYLELYGPLDLGELVTNKGVDGLLAVIAFCAMIEDIEEMLE